MKQSDHGISEVHAVVACIQLTKPTFSARHDKRDLVFCDEREDGRELVSEEPCLQRSPRP
jgi:hypothetical protein